MVCKPGKLWADRTTVSEQNYHRAQLRATRHRCLTSTLGDGPAEHDPSHMIDPDYLRVVRDLAEAKGILNRCAAESTRTARLRLTDLLGIWPETPALMAIPHFHPYLQTVPDSLHVLDGGITERLLLYIGNWLYSRTLQKDDGSYATNWAAVQLVNVRLAASPPQQEFKHFGQPLYAINDDAKASTAHLRIKMAANWRCIEFEAVLPQLAYILKEHTEIVQVLMAYTDLYKTLRDVAPLLKNVTTAMRECAQPHQPPRSCSETQNSILERKSFILKQLFCTAEQDRQALPYPCSCLCPVTKLPSWTCCMRQVQTILGVLGEVGAERDGRRGSVRAQNARCAPHAGVHPAVWRRRQRAAR